MNLEAINKWLDEEYGCSYTRLEELHDFYFEKYCDLKQENQELKQKYLNAVSDYETTMFEKEQINSLVNSCQEEIRQLKKQLEEYQLQNINLIADIMIQKMDFPNKLIKDKTFYDLYNMPTYEELLDQQKEFIKYLEDESKEIYRDGGLRQNIFRQILQKYKSIIGVLDEKEN